MLTKSSIIGRPMTARVTAGNVDVGSHTGSDGEALYDGTRVLMKLALAAFGRAELYIDGDLVSAAREIVPGPLPVMLEAAKA